jgi:hypothetical protein
MADTESGKRGNVFSGAIDHDQHELVKPAHHDQYAGERRVALDPVGSAIGMGQLAPKL